MGYTEERAEDALKRGESATQIEGQKDRGELRAEDVLLLQGAKILRHRSRQGHAVGLAIALTQARARTQLATRTHTLHSTWYGEGNEDSDYSTSLAQQHSANWKHCIGSSN